MNDEVWGLFVAQKRKMDLEVPDMPFVFFTPKSEPINLVTIQNNDVFSLDPCLRNSFIFKIFLVGSRRIELRTRGFSGLCSTD